MNLTRLIAAAFIYLALVVVGATSAQAQKSEMYSIRQDASGGILNLRSGPGTGHDVLAAIPAGTGGIEISECVPADDGTSRYPFCRANWRAYSGWISSCCIEKQAHSDILSTSWPIIVKPVEGVKQTCDDASFESCGAFTEIPSADIQEVFRINRSISETHFYVEGPFGFLASCPMSGVATTSQDGLTLTCAWKEEAAEYVLLIGANYPDFLDGLLLFQISKDLQTCKLTVRQRNAEFVQTRYLGTCDGEAT